MNELSTQEILLIAEVCAELGMKRIRLTGGEPLLRKDIREIVAGISKLPGIEDLSLTTNA